MADRKPFIYTPRVPEISEPSILTPPTPTITTPEIYDPKIIEPYKPKQSSYMNYNDPYEINSITDIILGTFSKDMHRDSMFIGNTDLAEIPILNIIPAAIQYTKNAYITPISRGDWGAVGLNTLTNFSEVLDTLANPVKGYAMDGAEGVKDAFGVGGVGRKNFDWDTGNIVNDMAKELISDPLNWVTLFGKGAISSSIKAMTKSGLAEIGGATGEVIADKAYKKIAGAITDSFLKGETKDTLGEVAQSTAKKLMKTGKAPYQFTEEFLNNLNKFNLDNTTAHILQSINTTVVKPAEALDSALFKVGVGLPYAAGYLVKKSGQAVWELAHTNLQEGLKQFKTPLGNLDILQYDAINDYANRFDETSKEIFNMAKEFPTEETKKIYIQEAVLKEVNALKHFMQIDLKEIPNVNMQGKLKLLEDYINNEIGLKPGVLMDVLEDINQTTDNKYKWLYDWLHKQLDPESAKLADLRAETWTMVKDLQTQVKQLKETPSMNNFDTLSKYIENNYHITMEDFFKQTDNFEISLGADFTWYKDYFENNIKSLELNPVYSKKNDVSKKIYEILTAPKELEAETRVQLLDTFIAKEHPGVKSLDDYIERLKVLNEKYPDTFTDYIKKLEDTKTQLELIDETSKQFAVKKVIEENVQHSNHLLQNQKELLAKLPEAVEHLTGRNFVTHVLEQNNVRMSLMFKNGQRLGYNPKAYEKYVLKAEFTEKTLDNYIEEIHDAYNTHIDSIMDKLATEDSMLYPEYVDKVQQVYEAYQRAWGPLARKLRSQAMEHTTRFEVGDYFNNLVKKISNIVADADDVLQKYHKTIAKADILNNTTDLETLLQKSAKDYQEAFNKVMNFGSVKELAPLRDKLMILQRETEITEEDFQSLRKTFFVDLLDFFDVGEQAEISIQDMIDTWMAAFGESRTDINVPKFYHDAFAGKFEELFTAMGANDFTTFIDSAEEIMFYVQALSMQSKANAETFKPLYDLFNKYNLGVYKPLTADISAEDVWYHFKLEQDYVLTSMMADPDVNKFIAELMAPESELGGMFKNMLLTQDPQAQSLMDTLASYVNYREFLNTLYQFVGNPKNTMKVIDHDVIGAFTSTLQKYAMCDPDTVLKNLDNSFYYIMQQTEQQINSMVMTKNLSLDKLIPTLEKDPAYAEILKGLEAHHAFDDAIRTEIVCDAEKLNFTKQFGENIKIIHFDIETTGLEGQAHQITEIGLRSKDLGLNAEFIHNNTDLMQSRAMVAGAVRKDTHASELDLLKAFMAELNKYDEEGQRIVINMHNGFAFDKKFIMNRFEYYYNIAKTTHNVADEKFCVNALAQLKSGKYKFSDSLKMLQEKYGYTVISAEDRLNLYYVLRNFALKQQGMGKLLQPLDPSIAKQLKDMGGVLQEQLGPAGADRYKTYFDHANAIYTVFQSVKTANKDLSRILLKKSIFEDAAFQKAFGALNITQVLNTMDGEIIDGVKRYGVKKHLDAKAVMEYFNDTVLTEAQMLFRTNIARDIDREYSQLKHISRLKYHAQDMQDILKTFIERALRSSRVPEDLARLKVSNNYMTNFAILRKIFTWQTNAFKDVPVNTLFLKTGEHQVNYATNLLDGLCSDLLARVPDLRELLEKPKLVRNKPFFDDGSISQAVDLEIQTIWDTRNLIRRQEYEAQYAEKIAAQEEEYAIAKEGYLDTEWAAYQEKVANDMIETDKAIEYQCKTVKDFEKKLNFNEVLANYEGYYKSIEQVFNDYSNINDIIENLGKGWDDNGAQRAVVQVRATALKETYAMLKAVKERHVTIKDITEQFKQVMKYRDVSKLLSRQQISSVLSLNDKDLFAHLVNNARRLIIFDGFELTGKQLKNLMDRTEALETQGIHTVFKNDKIYWALDKDIIIKTEQDAEGKIHHLVNGQRIEVPRLQSLNIDEALNAVMTDASDLPIRQSIKAIYDKLYNLVGDYTSDYSPHTGSIGELANKAYFKETYEMLPDEVKALLPHSDIMYADEFFHGASFNHTVLGGSEFRRQFHQYTNSDIISMLTSTMTVQAEYLKSHVEYMNMFFDKSLSITNGELGKFSDDTLLEALKNSDEYRLVALVNDKKFGAKVVDLNPQNVADIKKAKELGAVLMAYQTYSTAFGAINSYGMRHSKSNLLHKINYLYKMGYILTPGAFMRNVIDSVAKNYIAASDDMTGMTQSFLTAFQMYRKYRQTAQDLIKFSYNPALNKSVITKQSTADFFLTGVNRLTKEEYDFIHGFDVDGPSGGMIKEFEEYFRHGETYGSYDMITHIMNQVMEPTKEVEQICRLAEYIWAIEKDMPTTKAYALIAKTHFDYTIKTESQKLIELMFPFYTFTVNNIHFWLDAFDRVPALASVLRDVHTPIWNLDEYTPEELKYNRSLQYQILSGNLPLEKVFGDYWHNTTLKLNPSFMDVYQLATDPINSIKNKLAPLFQKGLDVAGQGVSPEMKYAYGISSTTSTQGAMQSILELLPIAGPIINRLFVQGPKYYERTGNPLTAILPSVFGATAELKKLQNYGHTYTPYTRMPKKPRKGYYKKARKYYAKRSFSWAKKYYPKKVYSSVGYSVDNFYMKMYTKTGKSRLKSMSIPVSSKTLAAQLKNMYYYYKW